MDAHTRNQMISNVGFLLITYVPLQIAAIWRQQGLSRLAAAAPLLVMVPMITGACYASVYSDGSLFGMYFVCPYLPAMLYLAAAVLNVPKNCPQCGQPLRRASFQQMPKLCPQCSQSQLQSSETSHE